MGSEPWWPSDHEFEFHNPYLFDKNETQGNVSMWKFQAQRAFVWEGILENNINHILRLYVKV